MATNQYNTDIIGTFLLVILQAETNETYQEFIVSNLKKTSFKQTKDTHKKQVLTTKNMHIEKKLLL